MELRRCEEQANELSALYESLRRQVESVLFLPKLVVDGDNNNAKEEEAEEDQRQNNNGTTSSKNNIALLVDDDKALADVIDLLNQLKSIMYDMSEKINKFRKRLKEVDPVTGNSRYGEKTQQRVMTLLLTYDFVNTNTTTNELLLDLEDTYKRQQQQREIDIAAKLQEETRKEQVVKEQERIRLEEEELKRRQEYDAKVKAEREEQELLHQRANQVRQARLLQQQQEQQWYDSIRKGPEGIALYLNKLKESTASVREGGEGEENGESSDVQKRAFHSLLTIFQQINAHPEETKFRRIRRNHEQFVQDVGRHEGGIEVLVAAGFVLGAVDDIPCYLSKEPDIEKDMDGWSKWFDLNKVTLELLQKAVEKL